VTVTAARALLLCARAPPQEAVPGGSADVRDVLMGHFTALCRGKHASLRFL